jgi:hypothetical protein
VEDFADEIEAISLRLFATSDGNNPFLKMTPELGSQQNREESS